jgi:hypothetical protein
MSINDPSTHEHRKRLTRRRQWRSVWRFANAPWEQSFRQFKRGAVTFGCGLALLMYTNAAIAPSITQELVALLALCLVAVGFVVAITAHLRMLLARLLYFFLADKPKPNRDTEIDR